MTNIDLRDEKNLKICAKIQLYVTLNEIQSIQKVTCYLVYNVCNSFITAKDIHFFARSVFEKTCLGNETAFKGSFEILRSSFTLAELLSLLFAVKCSNDAVLIGL